MKGVEQWLLEFEKVKEEQKKGDAKLVRRRCRKIKRVTLT